MFQSHNGGNAILYFMSFRMYKNWFEDLSKLDKKLYIYSGHDTNIVGFMQNFLTKQYMNSLPNKYPIYASRLIIEVREDENSLKYI